MTCVAVFFRLGEFMNKQKQKKEDLLAFAGNYRMLNILGCVLAAISAVLGVVPFIYIWLAVQNVFTVMTTGGELELVSLGIKAVVFALVSMLVYAIGLFCTHISAFRTAKNLRSSALHHLLTLPLGFFTANNSGKIRREIDDCSAQTESYLAHQLPSLTAAMVSPIVAVILLFVFDWRLGLISLIPFLIGMVFMRSMMGKKTMEAMGHYQNALGEMNGTAVEYIRGMSVVKAFGQSVFSFKKFHNSIEAYKEWAVKYTVGQRLPMVGYTVAINANFLLLVPAGILLIGSAVNPEVFILDFIFYVIFTPFLVSGFNKILWSSDQTMLAQDAMRRIRVILDEKPLVEIANPIAPNGNDIRFENVTFTYPNAEVPAVEDVNLEVSEGQTIALVGHSGGGKSTVAMLIARFWDAEQGKIEIGGVDVKNISSKELQNRVSFVFQDNRLFKTTLLDNIKGGKIDATDSQVQSAIKAAQCSDIIAKLPEGLNTVVGTKGVYFSGGEMQRIALARAILKDAPIVVLDEATAFADSENERLIQKALESLLKGKTVVMIAHRLTTVQNADKIFVMQNGKVVEQGNHNDLLKENGIYTKMWQGYQTATEWKIGKEVLA